MVTWTLYTCNKNEQAPGFTKVHIWNLQKYFAKKLFQHLKKLLQNISLNDTNKWLQIIALIIKLVVTVCSKLFAFRHWCYVDLSSLH